MYTQVLISKEVCVFLASKLYFQTKIVNNVEYFFTKNDYKATERVVTLTTFKYQ